MAWAAQWERLQAAFADALTCTGEARRELVSQLRREDEELGAELARLLTNITEADRHFEHRGAKKAHIALAQAVTRKLDEAVMSLPARIGPYVPESLLGTGGMGVVFLASEIGSAQRKVAVKVMRMPWLSPTALARFETEHHALAKMNHPAIAQIYHAGQTDRQCPYFAMEYVPGPSITEFCDLQRLDVGARIALMIAVCDGVAHAHRQAVIHRDIKPSNILVTRQDGRSVPKLIDFGIAKTLGEPLTGHTLETDDGTFLGTPIYACPEQLASGPIDTRSDVYGLGTVLYELLCGQPLIDPTLFGKASLCERIRLIGEVEPLAPSARFLAMGTEQRRNIAALHGLSPNALKLALGREVDWICGKALAKDRRHRYESVICLRDDLQRFLDGLPVQAAPANKTYRFRKMLWRHRGKVAAVCAAVFALFAGTLLLGRAYLAAEHSRKQTLRAQLIAQQRAAELQVVNDFLQELVTSSNPNRHGRDVRVVDVLEDADEKLNRHLKGNRHMEAGLRFALGRTWYGLGLHEEAQLQLAISIRLWQSLSEPPVVHLMDARALRGRSLKHLDDLDEAEQEFERVFQLQSLHPRADPTGGLVRQMGYANLLRARDQLEHAEWICRNILSDPKFANLSEPDQALAMVALANVLISHGQWSEARTLYLHAFAIQKQVLGQEHPQFLATSNNLALCAREQGDHLEAADLYEEVVGLRACVLGSDHPQTVNSRQGLALAYYHLGRWQEAEALLEDVLTTRRRVLAPHHHQVLVTLNNLLLVKGKLGKHEQLVVRFEEVLRIYERTGRRLHSSALKARNNMGDALIQLQQYPRAIAVLEETLALKEQRFHPEDATTLITRCTLAEAFQAAGQPEKALPHFQTASRLAASNPEIRPRQVTLFKTLLVDCLTQMGRLNEARQLLRTLEAAPAGQEKRIRACRDNLQRHH